MRKQGWRRLGYGLIIPILILATGCMGMIRGEVRTESETIPLNGAESVRVEIAMAAGQLTVGGGADDLMEAEFTYSVPDWRPEVQYSVNGSEGELVVRGPTVDNPRQLVGDQRYEWTMQLQEDVPLKVYVNLPAGECTLNLAELTLRDLEIDAGAGDCTVDLAGAWEQDLTATIRGGVGRLNVYVPEDVGVRATVDGGIGQVNAGDLQRETNSYVNEALDTSDVTLTLDIQGAIGEINLLTR